VPGEPYFPKKIPIVGAAFAGSLLLLSLITMLRELFAGRAFTPASRIVRESGLAPQASMAVAPTESAPNEVFAPEVAEREAEFAPEERAEPSLMSFSPEAEPAPPPAPQLDPEHSIKAITDRLIEKGASRAIIVSPEGDEAAASAVLIVRELADRGLRSILLDLTSSGSASHPMIDGFALPGITNLLASQAQFRDIIHSDPYSGAHVIPNGTAEPGQAMRAVERLPIIVNALTTAYDTVIVECGPADPKGIARLVTPGSEIIMSVINPDDASIVKSAAALQDAGYEDILLVTPVGSMPMAPEPDRSALRRA
jgi:Mrp family chromosome partitioning ATPase